MKQDTDTIKKHREMVLRLAKPGAAILESLTPWDCDLIHMAGCPGGEAAELYDAVIADLASGSASNNEVDLLEELGDYAFYLVKCRAIFEMTEWHGLVSHVQSPTNNCIELMRLGGHFWDVAKRVVIYRKPIDISDPKYDGQFLRDVALNFLGKMEQHFNALITYYNFTLDEVLDANWTKLASADKGRFSSGSYSDEQAQARKDKQ